MTNRIFISVLIIFLGCAAISCGGDEPQGGGGTQEPTPPPPPTPDVPEPDRLLSYLGYTQLTDEQKNLYTHLRDTLSNYKYESNEFLKLYYYDILKQGFNPTHQSLQMVLNRLRDDNPQLFHLGNIVPYTYEGQGVRELKINFFVNRSTYDRMLAKVVAKADKILECVTASMTPYDKAKAIHDTFLANVSYGMSLGDEGSVYGAMVNGKVVCEGYARALEYLYQRAGLRSLYVQGVATSSGTLIMHAWTIVEISGVNYYIDSTWDDSIAPNSTDCHWDYFLKSSSFMTSHGYFPMQDPNYPESQMGVDAESFRQNATYMTTLPLCPSNY